MIAQIKTSTITFIMMSFITIAAFAVALPALAFWQQGDSGDDNDINVTVSNQASVTNNVDVEAETGDNEADGGDGEEGGNGGEAEGAGDNTGGNGGNGGSGALGGYIITGDATSWVTVSNNINRVRTNVVDTSDDDDDDSSSTTSLLFPFLFNQSDGDDNDVRVRVENSASLTNNVDVEAETGDNEADGGDGEEGGNGGDAERRGNTGIFSSFFSFLNPGTNEGGHGGTGGNGGVGGEIFTGDATSGADVVNVINRTITRVTR